MKKLFLILTTALFAAGFASCTDDPEETVNPVVVSEILRALGGNVLVNVPEENFDVNIPADAASWVQINEAESSGKALVLSVDENETGTERSTVGNVTRQHYKSPLLCSGVTNRRGQRCKIRLVHSRAYRFSLTPIRPGRIFDFRQKIARCVLYATKPFSVPENALPLAGIKITPKS